MDSSKLAKAGYSCIELSNGVQVICWKLIKQIEPWYLKQKVGYTAESYERYIYIV